MKTTIKINNIKIYGYHGLTKEEKTLGQKFEIDVELHFDSKSNIHDTIESTIDYSLICNDIKDEFLRVKCNLIEHLGSKIIDRLFERYNLLYSKINIRKPNAPINIAFDSVEVEVEKDVRGK